MKKISFLAVALAATMLASCSKENTNTPPPAQEGVKTYAQIELNLTRSNSTRATFDGGFAGLASETAIDNVRLYVFNSVGLLEDVADFTANQATDVVEVTSGSKNIIALVNMAGNYPTTSTSTSLTSFLEEVAATGSLALIAQAGEFWMSNSTPVTATLQEWDGTGTAPSSNVVPISVSRMAAKIGVEFAPTTELGAGKLTASTVEYKINNNPGRTRLFSKRDAGFLMTPWYDVDQSSAITGTYWNEAVADYKTTSVGAVNAGEFDATSVGYMIENSNQIPLNGNATYAVIRGQWVPDELVDEDGLNPVTTNPNSNGEFWRIKNALGDWEPEYYYENPDAAVVGTGTPYHYADGLAYYALYINDTETPGLASEDKYVIERNTQWSVSITSVSGCGENGENELPGIVDPTDPLDVDTYMRATITVNPWVDRGQQGGI